MKTITVYSNLCQFEKTKRRLCPPLAVCPLRQLLPNNRHFDILSIKEVFGGHQWNFWQWVGRTSFRFDLRDNDCLAPNEKTQTSPLSSRKKGFAHPSLPPSSARVRSRVLIQANIPTFHISDSYKLQYFTRSKPKRFLVITSKAVLPSGSLGKQHSTVIHRLY